MVRKVAYTVGFLIAIYAATVAIQLYQPATGGYFNLGEAAIYAAALTATPGVAAIAAGVGSALADLTTGYAIFAPGTLVIKACEGYVAAVLSRRLRRLRGPVAAGIAGLVVGGLVASFGVIYLSGTGYFGTAWASVEIHLPWPFWLLVGGVVAVAVAAAVSRSVYAGEVAAVLIAGMVMVTGYFLYEYFISNPLTGRPPIHALAEVPVNMGQAVVGAAVGVPLAAWLRRAGYTLEAAGQG
ncbi:MAG: ECF transporter S component [Crenarchaeota archaeon]|nr:ECF transporter S component [Thermoproteota archaeon]